MQFALFNAAPQGSMVMKKPVQSGGGKHGEIFWEMLSVVSYHCVPTVYLLLSVVTHSMLLGLMGSLQRRWLCL